MSDVEQLVRETLRRHDAEVPMAEPAEARAVTVRARRRQVMNAVRAGLIATIIAVAAVSGVGALLRADQRRPAIEPIPTPPGPSFARVDFPPAGVEPSTPVTGQPVISFSAEDVTQVALPEADRWEGISIDIYADGRVIWSRCRSLLATLGSEVHRDTNVGCVVAPAIDASGSLVSTGWVQQRLTPEGVELLRSELLGLGLLERDFESVTPNSTDLVDYLFVEVRDDGGRVNARADYQVIDFNPPTRGELAGLEHVQEIFMDLERWLPNSAWADEEVRVFVPPTYSFWFKTGSASALRRDAGSLEVVAAIEPRALPSPADVLLTREGCSVVTLDEAREVVAALEAAGIERLNDDAMAYLVIDEDPGAALYFEANVQGDPSGC